MAKHSKIGASSAHRWLVCPGSVRLSEGLDKPASEYALEGTAAHALAELAIKEKKRADDYVGHVIEAFTVTDEMADAVQVYLDVLAKEMAGMDYDTEVRFDLSHLYPGLYGTADAVGYREKDKALLVFDYKHGAGKPVDVENNPQLMYYALGAAYASRNWGPKKIVLTVVQPRCAHAGGQVRSWELRPVDLIEWSFDLVEAAKKTGHEDAALVPGDHCRWCPAAAICPALAKKAQEAAKLEFTPAVPYNPDDLARALTLAPLLKDWVKSVEEFALLEAQQGRCPPGRKLVQTLGNRKWGDEESVKAAAEKYGMDHKDIFTEKLRTVAQLEKVVGKKDFAENFGEYIVREAGVALADADDPRPGVREDVKDAFG